MIFICNHHLTLTYIYINTCIYTYLVKNDDSDNKSTFFLIHLMIKIINNDCIINNISLKVLVCT